MLSFYLLTVLVLIVQIGCDSVTNGAPQETIPRPVIDSSLPGWRPLIEKDFEQVNSESDTWNWKNAELFCSGTPISVLRTTKEYTNFEMVVEWKHQKAAGNSGVFIWTTPASIERLESPNNPGPRFPME